MVTLQEYFTLHINSVFLFVGFINVVSGALIYNKYKDRESFVDPALILVPLLMTILGSCTIGLALLGCFGMALRSKLRSIIFFTLNMLIMFSEICLGSYWWHDSKNFMQFPQLFNWFLQSDLSTGEEWATLQIKSNCCGVHNAYDYVGMNRSVPSYCCQRNSYVRTYLYYSRYHLCTASMVTKPGCTAKLKDDFRGDQQIIICQLLIAGLIKALFLAASFVIPFEQKVMLTETHDAISLASTVSIEDPEDVRADNEAAIADQELADEAAVADEGVVDQVVVNQEVAQPENKT